MDIDTPDRFAIGTKAHDGAAGSGSETPVLEHGRLKIRSARRSDARAPGDARRQNRRKLHQRRGISRLAARTSEPRGPPGAPYQRQQHSEQQDAARAARSLPSEILLPFDHDAAVAGSASSLI